MRIFMTITFAFFSLLGFGQNPSEFVKDNCTDVPATKLCQLDGLVFATEHYTANENIDILLNNFCEPNTHPNNSAFIKFKALTSQIEVNVLSDDYFHEPHDYLGSGNDIISDKRHKMQNSIFHNNQLMVS